MEGTSGVHIARPPWHAQQAQPLGCWVTSHLVPSQQTSRFGTPLVMVPLVVVLSQGQEFGG